MAKSESKIPNDKKKSTKIILKVIIPSKAMRKLIRQKIQDRNSADVPPISIEDKNMLKGYYKDDVRQLSELLGRDLNYWTK